MESQQTPFSPCSFDFYPGSLDDSQQNSEMKTFRFAGAPDGPLPSIPSGEEGTDSEPEITIRKRVPSLKLHEKEKTYQDFPWLCCFSSIFCVIGGITFAVASHKVRNTLIFKSTKSTY